MRTLIDCLYVGAGGLLGTILRYLAGLLPVQRDGGFPFMTLAINVTGAFLIGLITALATQGAGIRPRALLFCRVGVCGGFTTFSTFALEAHSLLRGGKPLIGAAYAALSVALCIAAVACANALAE